MCHYVNFTIQNMTREYDDVTMTVQAGGSEDDVSHKSFTLVIYGEYLFFYFVWCDCGLYESSLHLTLKQSVVDTGMTDGLCYSDMAAGILEPNVDGYDFSVWPNAYPGNGSQ